MTSLAEQLRHTDPYSDIVEHGGGGAGLAETLRGVTENAGDSYTNAILNAGSFMQSPEKVKATVEMLGNIPDAPFAVPNPEEYPKMNTGVPFTPIASGYYGTAGADQISKGDYLPGFGNMAIAAMSAIPVIGPAAKTVKAGVKAGPELFQGMKATGSPIKAAKPQKITKRARRVNTTGQYVGAPQGVNTPAKLEKMIDKYLERALDGIEGRDWYEVTNKYINDITPNPETVEPFSGALAVTSQRAKLDMNYGQAVKGHNQLKAGDAVHAGGFWNAMSRHIKQLYGKGPNPDLGPKRGPYWENMHLQKGARPVHDIWDGRAWGYKNTDGTPFSGGFSETQHEFLDMMADEAVKRANEMKLGGFDDWDLMKIQAAPWTGQRIKAGEMAASEAGMTYANLSPKYSAIGNREYQAGEGFSRYSDDLKGDLDKILYDGADVDILGKHFEALQTPSTSGTGYYAGNIDEGMAVPMQVGRDTVPLQETFDTTAKGGYNVINESSRKLMDARESTYGLLMQQDAAAWHYMKLADNTPLYTHNGVEFGIDATNRADFEKLAAHFESKYGADDVAIVHGEGKARVVLLDDDVSKYRDFLEEARNFAKENNVSIRSGHTDTGYINGKWENGVPKSYLEAIDSVPGAAEALDKVLPGMAKDILSTIERHGGDIPEISRKVYQALAEGGLEGLRNLSVSAGVVGVIALEILSQIESGAGNGAYTDV